MREREWQAAQSVTLWVDRARSMGFSGAKDRLPKSDRARLLALALGVLLLRGGERVGLAGGAAPKPGRTQVVTLAAGLAAEDRPYGEMGVVANFACAKAHRHIARQWFRHDGVLAWLPLPGERISMVWSTPDEHARTLLSLPEAALCSRVSAAGNDELGPLALLTPPAAFPLRLLRVPQTIALRLALIGDAAHGIHPLSGHGINLGFQDARVLAGLLAAAPEWQDLGGERLLARYRRARKEETVLMQTATHMLHGLFHETLPGLGALRNAGLSLTNRLPWIKDLCVRYAVGAL